MLVAISSSFSYDLHSTSYLRASTSSSVVKVVWTGCTPRSHSPARGKGRHSRNLLVRCCTASERDGSGAARRRRERCRSVLANSFSTCTQTQARAHTYTCESLHGRRARNTPHRSSRASPSVVLWDKPTSQHRAGARHDMPAAGALCSDLQPHTQCYEELSPPGTARSPPCALRAPHLGAPARLEGRTSCRGHDASALQRRRSHAPAAEVVRWRLCAPRRGSPGRVRRPAVS